MVNLSGNMSSFSLAFGSGIKRQVAAKARFLDVTTLHDASPGVLRPILRLRPAVPYGCNLQASLAHKRLKESQICIRYIRFKMANNQPIFYIQLSTLANRVPGGIHSVRTGRKTHWFLLRSLCPMRCKMSACNRKKCCSWTSTHSDGSG